MLKIIRSFKQMHFGLLADVYTESCKVRGMRNYPDQPEAQQIFLAEQDLYAEVNCFFQDKNAFYAIWQSEGKYVSVLRMEPYDDGLLLEGLETVQQERGKGYAKALVSAVLSELYGQGEQIIYAHIDKNNNASAAVHQACGFVKVLDYAVFADGSVSQNAYTMKIRI